MKVLIGCEYSGIVRDAFLERGHYALSVDWRPTESPRGDSESILCADGRHHTLRTHWQGDITDFLSFTETDWNLLIAHPPCTRIANSGVRWLHERHLWEELDKACGFLRALLYTDIPRIAVENPIPHHYAVQRIGRNYDQRIQPWQFGHPESKAICLWLKGLEPLKPTNVVKPTEQRVWKMAPSPNREKERSRFYSGVAQAMAEQWG